MTLYARLASLAPDRCKRCNQNHAKVEPPRQCLLRNNMTAVFGSKCVFCCKGINTGDKIAKGIGGFMHVECAAMSLHGLDRAIHGEPACLFECPPPRKTRFQPSP